MRVIIRVDLGDIMDEKAVELRKAIELLVKDLKDTRIDVTMLSR